MGAAEPGCEPMCAPPGRLRARSPCQGSAGRSCRKARAAPGPGWPPAPTAAAAPPPRLGWPAAPPARCGRPAARPPPAPRRRSPRPLPKVLSPAHCPPGGYSACSRRGRQSAPPLSSLVSAPNACGGDGPAAGAHARQLDGRLDSQDRRGQPVTGDTRRRTTHRHEPHPARTFPRQKDAAAATHAHAHATAAHLSASPSSTTSPE